MFQFSLMPRYLKIFLKRFMRGDGWKKTYRSDFETVTTSVTHLLPAFYQKAIYEKLVWESGYALMEIGFSRFYKNPPTKVDESKITCPLLVIGATQDRIIPVSIVKKVADKYRATYKEFPNHAHSLLIEKGWFEIAEYILNWLQVHTSKPLTTDQFS
jgi:pimeloyl-ACP methyl ester carboxylesterase